MYKCLPIEPVGNTGIPQDGNAAFFEQAGADSTFDVFPGLSFKDNRRNAVQVEQMGKQKSRGARSDDADAAL